MKNIDAFNQLKARKQDAVDTHLELEGRKQQLEEKKFELAHRQAMLGLEVEKQKFDLEAKKLDFEDRKQQLELARLTAAANGINVPQPLTSTSATSPPATSPPATSPPPAATTWTGPSNPPYYAQDGAGNWDGYSLNAADYAGYNTENYA